MTAPQHDTRPTILVVHPQPGRAEELKGGVPQYTWVEAPPNWPDRSEEWTGSTAPDAIIVDAEGESDEQVLETCQTLRNVPPLQDRPLLVAISMYRMHLSHQIKQFPRTDIIIYPIEESDIRRQLASAENATP
jgi:CheY-like chemotaxis protein